MDRFRFVVIAVGPFFRWRMTTTWAVLLPSHGAVASCVLAGLLPWGAFFPRRTGNRDGE